jgi:hypothetical protein
MLLVRACKRAQGTPQAPQLSTPANRRAKRTSGTSTPVPSLNQRMEHVASILCEMLEAAIHTILYVRSVYPASESEAESKRVYVISLTFC